MLPTLGSVHQNAALNNVAVGFKPPMYKADLVFPTVPVAKESDYFYTWTQADIRRNEAKKVRPGEKAPRGGFSVTAATYTADEWKFAWPIPDRVRNNMDVAIRAEVNATMRVMDKILLAKEIEVASLLATAGNWGATAAETGYWDAGNGDPLGKIETGNQTVKMACGFPANTMALSWKSLRALRKHPQLLEHLSVIVGSGVRSAGNGPAFAGLEQIAWMTDIPRIIVFEANYNTAAEGQTASYSEVMTDNVWIGYVAPSAAIDEPSAGYTFQVQAPAIRTFREDAEEQDVVEAKVNFVSKVTMAASGYVITDVLS